MTVEQEAVALIINGKKRFRLSILLNLFIVKHFTTANNTEFIKQRG